MTKLLVSVRSTGEMAAALAGGADVVDVKEPRLGSLGAASPEVLRSISTHLSGLRVDSHGPLPLLSAAMGELRDYCSGTDQSHLVGFSFAKVGLAGMGTDDVWIARWHDWMADLPPKTTPVAVIYADYRQVHSPDPWKTISAARSANATMLLIDTCLKGSGNLFHHLEAAELSEIVSEARSARLQVALAGSLALEDLDAALSVEPDLIAVRGGVCRGGRGGVLDCELVKRFANRLSTLGRPPHARSRVGMIDACTRQI